MTEREHQLDRLELLGVINKVNDKNTFYTYLVAELQGKDKEELRLKILNSKSQLQMLELGLTVASGLVPLEVALKVCGVEDIDSGTGIVEEEKTWWKDFLTEVSRTQTLFDPRRNIITDERSIPEPPPADPNYHPRIRVRPRVKRLPHEGAGE